MFVGLALLVILLWSVTYIEDDSEIVSTEMSPIVKKIAFIIPPMNRFCSYFSVLIGVITEVFIVLTIYSIVCHHRDFIVPEVLVWAILLVYFIILCIFLIFIQLLS